MDYVSCSPFRVPIARLATAQAVIKEKIQMESLYSEKGKNISKLFIENVLKPVKFVKGFFSWYFSQRETLEVKLKQRNAQIEDLKVQLNIVNHMYEEGRNLLKEQKRDLEEMLKMEREGANIPSMIQLGNEKTKM